MNKVFLNISVNQLEKLMLALCDISTISVIEGDVPTFWICIYKRWKMGNIKWKEIE